MNLVSISFGFFASLFTAGFIVTLNPFPEASLKAIFLTSFIIAFLMCYLLASRIETNKEEGE